jgi:prepilin-type N-terminal cleavage/methylation domain-containing protein
MNYFFIKKETQQSKNSQKAFTLIEVMVAMAIFSVVMMIGISSVLSVNNAYFSEKKERVVASSLGFIMEEMVRELRTASDISCSQTTPKSDCIVGNNYITFINQEGCKVEYFSETVTLGNNQSINVIKRERSSQNQPGISPCQSEHLPLSLTEVTRLSAKVTFFVLGASNNATETKQPLVHIIMQGETRGQQKKKIFLESSVMQRQLDIPV